MNATEDESEPMGEAPALEVTWPVNYPPNTAVVMQPPPYVEQIPVLGESERQAIAEIRELHGRSHGVKLSIDSIPDDEAKWACGQCMQDGGPHDPAHFIEIPCPTILILDKWGV